MNKTDSLTLVTVCLVSRAAFGASIFDTLGTSPYGAPQVLDGLAQSFETDSQSYVFSSVQLHLNPNAGGINYASIFLCSDLPPQPPNFIHTPASVIEQLSGPGVISQDGLYTYSGAALLAPNTPYWIVARSGGMTYDWRDTLDPIPLGQSVMGSIEGGESLLPGVWTEVAASFQMEVDATVVPEPKSLFLMLGLSLFGMIFLRRH